MSTKLRIVGELGERKLLLPELLDRALQANERVKLCFTLLQAARDHALRPDLPPADLRLERERAGLADAALDDVVSESRALDGGAYHVPQAERVLALALEGIREMLEPLRVAAEGGGEGADDERDAIVELERRLERLTDAAPEQDRESIDEAALDAITRAERGGGDSLHLVVMDAHKRLNRLQARLAQERIDGAHAYGIGEGDRELVRAFMRGLNRTAPLKFDHPGLDTTATRSGETLVIQNDIGTTDAHVLVIRVRGLTAETVYTDVHAERARFFRERMAPFSVAWKEVRTRPGLGPDSPEGYELDTGVFEAKERAELERFLEHLGSRIVFLIDWNKARKRLRLFVGKQDAYELLARAADGDYGQRAFLELGGEKLVFDAIEKAVHAHVRYGQRLDEVLGRAQTMAFLELVMRGAAAGLLAGRSEALLRDEVRAELANCFRSARDELLSLAADHAALVSELAAAVRDGLADARAGGGELTRRNARRARGWEQRADGLLNRAREILARSATGENEVFRAVLESSDDAADGLEEAAFLATLLPESLDAGAVRGALCELARVVARAAQEFVKCVEAAACVHRGGARELVQDFLESVDRLNAAEHETDALEREVTAHLVREVEDARALHVAARVAQALEGSVDALRRCGYLLRDHVLGSVMLS